MTIQNPKQVPPLKTGVNIFLLNFFECPICNGHRKLRNDIDDAILLEDLHADAIHIS